MALHDDKCVNYCGSEFIEMHCVIAGTDPGFQIFLRGHTPRYPKWEHALDTKQARPTLSQTPHFISLNFAAIVMLTIYGKSNLKSKPATPLIYSGSVPEL